MRIIEVVEPPTELNDAFQRWFKDSKVVDASGRPLIVYHGTNRRAFDAFSKEKVSPRYGANQARIGYFFTDAEDLARRFAGRGKRSRVIAAYLSLQNPLVVPARPSGLSFTDTIENDFTEDETSVFLDRALQAGHDGFIFRTGDGFSEYAAIRPTQIKSIYNNGNFDPNDPRIDH